MNTIGSRFRQARHTLGFTQEQIANGLCDRSYISLFEQDKISPPVNLLILLADKVGLSLQSLVGNNSRVLSMQSQLLYLDDVTAKGNLGEVVSYLEQLWWDATRSHDMAVIRQICRRVGTLLASGTPDNLSWPTTMMMWLLDQGEREEALVLGYQIQHVLFGEKRWSSVVQWGKTLLSMPINDEVKIRIAIANGSALLHEENLKQAEQAYQDVVEMLGHLTHSSRNITIMGLAWTNHGLSAVHGSLQNWQQAYEEAQRANEIYTQLHSPMRWLALQNVGIIQGALGNRTSAYQTLSQCKEYWTKVSNFSNVADVENDLNMV